MDSTSLNPAGSHLSSSCCVKPLCSPYNQKASVLWGVLPPKKSSQQVIFNNAPCRLNMAGRKHPRLQSILGVKHPEELQPGSLTSPNAEGHRLRASPVKKSEPCFPTQSPCCLPLHYWHTNSCVQPSSIQELPACSSSTPPFTRGFFLCFVQLCKRKKASG